MLVAPEEHDSALVVDFVHGVEVGDFGVVDEVDGGEVLHEVGGAVEDLVHGHYGRGGGDAEAEDDDAVGFAEDGLVDVPAVKGGLVGFGRGGMVARNEGERDAWDCAWDSWRLVGGAKGFGSQVRGTCQPECRCGRTMEPIVVGDEGAR